MAKSKQKKRKRDRNADAIAGESGANEKKRKAEQLVPASSDRSDKSTSLAQLLKKHRGVAADTAPPSIWVDNGGNRRRNFLTPQDDPKSFDACLRTSFSGFHYDPPEALPSSLHSGFGSSFGGMDKGGLFLYDAVQPGKRRLTRTSVTRTLVGDPGSTYKYLGLRLFSHPWVDVDRDGNEVNNEQSRETNGSTLQKLGYSGQTASALITMGKINAALTKRTKSMLQEHVAPNVNPEGLVGSADFNLTLVNKMESTSTKRDMKKEATYGMGRISVGWHRDSGLKDFSSIAVYQSLKEAKNDHSWGVALRAMDGGDGGPIENVPAMLVPLPSGSLYYMLDEFNHNHEHAVVAGSGGVRYSSTHRVAREGRGTYRYIRDKIRKFRSTASDFDWNKGTVTACNLSPKKRGDKLASRARVCQNLMTEIEFEWLRQWHVQGRRHASLHPYWHAPVDVLCGAFRELEGESRGAIDLLAKLSEGGGAGESDVTEDLFDVLIEAVTERSKLRASWHERYRDPVFSANPVDERPFPCPCLDRQGDDEGCMPENLDGLVLQLRRWRSAFVAKSQEGDGVSGAKGKNGKKKKEKKASLTKREAKGRASNWERLKANLKG